MADGERIRDFAVVGGGIAGLAIAEMLQRSGASVILLEKNRTLCSEASAEQQGWFHTGALYTALPSNFFCRTMVGNLDDLMDYYSGFPGMNLRVDKHIYTTDRDGWFSNRTNFYVYTSTDGVSWKWKLPWAVALYRAKRRMSWFETLDTSRSLSHQMGFGAKPLKYVVHGSTLGVNLEHVAFALKSRDRAMNTQRIAEDLLRSFLACGGTVRTQAKVLSLDRGAVLAKLESGEMRIPARHTILATGKDTTAFDGTTKVFISPLLVVYPALTDLNFVRMSPHMDQTINHLCHRNDGLEYSLIGNAVYHDSRQVGPEVLDRVRAGMVRMARRVFGDFDEKGADLFFGYKTEVSSSSFIRNYLYHIIDRGHYTLALPGKFSLCFSLAANVCRHFGIEPVKAIRLAEPQAVEGLIEEPLHSRLAKRLAEKSRNPS
ncbi:MAG: FAD-dependent oxidoreductase [Nitrospirota bacterium]